MADTKKPLSTESLKEMLPLIGWKYFESPNGLNDKLISHTGNASNFRISKDNSFEYRLNGHKDDYYHISHTIHYDEYEIEHFEKEKFISIHVRGAKNPKSFMLLSGEK